MVKRGEPEGHFPGQLAHPEWDEHPFCTGPFPDGGDEAQEPAQVAAAAAALDRDVTRIRSSESDKVADIISIWLDTEFGQKELSVLASDKVNQAIAAGLGIDEQEQVIVELQCGGIMLDGNETFASQSLQDSSRISVHLLPWLAQFRSLQQQMLTAAVPILCKTQNHQHRTGEYRDQYIFNPRATGPAEVQLLQSLGELIASSVCHPRIAFPLLLHPMMWKALAGEPTGKSDLEAIDASIVQSLRLFQEGGEVDFMDAETFESCFFETFTTHSSASTVKEPHILELKPNGSSIPLTFDNMDEWAALVLETRLHEADEQVAHVKTGMASILSSGLPLGMDGRQLEQSVCGTLLEPQVDLEILRAHTQYGGVYNEDCVPVRCMWAALERLSPQDRLDFWRFVSGRRGLPALWTPREWKFKVEPGRELTARTSFHMLEMPPYTTPEEAYDSILSAVKAM